MPKVAIVFGGKSPEHEISIISAKSVFKNINKEKHIVSLIAITKKGEFFIGEGCFDLLERGDKNNVKKTTCNIFKNFDVVFPVLHGPYGEDGTIQGLLDFLGIPYVGCGIEASSICMHKGITRDLLKLYKIPQPQYTYFTKKGKQKGIEHSLKLKFPLFVKPCRGGSSIGITKVKREEELEKAIDLAFEYDDEVIVEEGINVSEELEVAVLGTPDDLTVSPPGGLIPGDEFYTYEDKYLNSKTEFRIPAQLDDKTIEKIKNYATSAFKAVHGKGMARIDFLYDRQKNMIAINEINTIPGFTEISMYPKLMEICGYSFEQLITKLIEIAIAE